jgi:dihydroorotate dehydrogenase (NAD+) catalytic subunit
MVNLAVNIAGIKMKNPVLTASGTYGFGVEYQDFFDIQKLGAIVVKGTTLLDRQGNPPPRMAETPQGMLNAVGLQNKGADYLIAEYLPKLAKLNVPVIVNVNGTDVQDYCALVEKLRGQKAIAGLELNISCPNVKKGGMLFGMDPVMAAELVTAVKKVADKPLIVKLSPNVTDIALIARAVEAAGADAISLINTVLGMAIDVETRRPKLSTITGGLSGPAVKPIAVRMVWQVAKAVKIPIIGMGGIASAADALEFILAGASAVAVGTANFINPLVTLKIIEGIKEYCVQHKVNDIQELVGALVQ